MSQRAIEAEAFLAMVEPPVNIQEELCPEPWFWVRGDDLTGLDDGDEVSGWPDRMDSGVVLSQSSLMNALPVFSDDVVDGTGGIRADGEVFNGAILNDDSFEKPMPDGFTVFLVVHEKGPVDIWEGFRAGQSGVGDNGFLQMYVADEGVVSTDGELYAEWVQFGSPPGVSVFAAYDTGFRFPSAVLLAIGPRTMRMAVNGVEQPISPELDVEEEYPSWDVTPVWRYMQLMSYRSDEQTAEVIVFDTLLTPECEAQWWQYLADRYPSLGIA